MKYRGWFKKKLAALMTGGATAGLLALLALAPPSYACACEGEEAGAGWMQNVAGWAFFALIAGVFVLSMVLFTIVMIRGNKKKRDFTANGRLMQDRVSDKGSDARGEGKRTDDRQKDDQGEKQ